MNHNALATRQATSLLPALLPASLSTPQEWISRILLERRFVSYVKRDGDCSIWTGGKTSRGYGVFFLAKINGHSIQHYAHRVAYTLAYGAIAEGLMVLHRCDNPSCVKPAHLFLGNQFDNMRDAAAKGRIRNQYDGWAT